MMKVSYTLSDEFFDKFISTSFEPKYKAVLRVILTILSGLLVLFSIMLLIAEDYVLFVFPFVMAILFFYISFLPKIQKRKMIKSADIASECYLELNDDNLIIAGLSRTTNINCSQIKEIKLIKDYFILIAFKPGDSVVIPKYAFSDHAQAINFINTVKTKAGILYSKVMNF